ncbi:MAG: type II toxin-antitoxin system PemK/MazF family toxin [Patescibacteria group bacterium]|mgnify:CR=1 FL=1
MDTFEIGDIVLVLFPFSDLKGQKLRPALVLAKAEFNNLILCQITSKSYASKTAISLTQVDFVAGGLPINSFIRPDKIFTAEASIIQNQAGKINSKKKHLVLERMQKMFTV